MNVVPKLNFVILNFPKSCLKKIRKKTFAEHIFEDRIIFLTLFLAGRRQFPFTDSSFSGNF